MPAGSKAVGLGVFMRERTRSIVVISDDGEAGVALRDHISPGQALVRDVRPHECADALEACVPWPWMVVVQTCSRLPSLAALLRTRPVLLTCLGSPPPDVATHARCATRFSELARMVESMLASRVGPMRLAVGKGVEVDGATCIRSAALEALVGAYPGGFDLPPRSFRAAAQALRELGIPWQPVRDDATGCTVLRQCPEEAPEE